jgi:sec-independent protein translocase protein TatC
MPGVEPKLPKPVEADPAAAEPGPPGDRKLTFSEHLDELRRHLVRATIAIVVFGALLGVFYEQVADFVMYPFEYARAELEAGGRVVGPLSYIDVTEGAFFYLKIVLYGAILFGAPYGLYELWRFISVGLYPKERAIVMRFVPYSMALFVAGVAFNYGYLLPTALSILLDYGDPERIRPEIRLDSYLGFFIMMNLVLGVVFQLPLVQVALARFGVMSAKSQGQHRKAFVLGAAVTSAILTPTGDAVTMLLVTIPMIGLFEIGLVIARRASASRDAETATERGA